MPEIVSISSSPLFLLSPTPKRVIKYLESSQKIIRAKHAENSLAGISTIQLNSYNITAFKNSIVTEFSVFQQYMETLSSMLKGMYILSSCTSEEYTEQLLALSPPKITYYTISKDNKTIKSATPNTTALFYQYAKHAQIALFPQSPQYVQHNKSSTIRAAYKSTSLPDLSKISTDLPFFPLQKETHQPLIEIGKTVQKDILIIKKCYGASWKAVQQILKDAKICKKNSF